jgi:hypothetical protein
MATNLQAISQLLEASLDRTQQKQGKIPPVLVDGVLLCALFFRHSNIFHNCKAKQ